MENITVHGARENNLRSVDLTIPKDKLIVFTGVSGSGKTSMAFDTLYADGQRRYIESLNSYARMFLGQMEKPDVDNIEGLSPAICIDQKTKSSSPRSTVGTITEIYDYLRLLYARIGHPHCPKCGKPIERQSIDQVVDKVLELGEGTRIQILAPMVRGRKGEHTGIFDKAKKSGYVRCRIDGINYELSDVPSLEKNKKHSIEIVVDRLVIKEGIIHRLTASIETAFSMAEGLMLLSVERSKGEWEDIIFSQNYACVDCGISIKEIEPRLFSFNNPAGACPECGGLGVKMLIDPELLIPDKTLSLSEGALKSFGWSDATEGTIAGAYFSVIGQTYHFSLHTPIEDIPEEGLHAILYGTAEDKSPEADKLRKQLGRMSVKNGEKDFEGVIPNLYRRFLETKSVYSRDTIQELMSPCPCDKCHGRRLSREALSVTVGQTDIISLTDMNVVNILRFFDELKLTDTEEMIARNILAEIRARLNFLRQVGLGYLTLSRTTSTLSGGESQRIRLATQIGSGLTGVLYILDEPSIGLHQSDNAKLLEALKNLRNLGNTLIVVEHDEDTMRAADWIVDFGPGAGVHGGTVVYSGDVDGIVKCENSITGGYLSGRMFVTVPETRRAGNGKYLGIKGANLHNLKNIDVNFPLGRFICITGVSGSGKSTLLNDVLLKGLKSAKPDFSGIENIDKIISIDQSPIGRTPRSNPATYIGVFTDIRDLYAELPEAKIRGFGKNRFSFNVKGGRCENCSGDGVIKVEMHFLPDVFVPCEVCEGKRYNRETLEVTFKGKNIHDVLEMTVDEACDFFSNQRKIFRKLSTLQEVGLGYMKLGQNSVTLSGGEAQRVKLASELLKTGTGNTLYLLDEPTTGLHTHDVRKLIDILSGLVDRGNTVIVIEHNLDVIKCADTIIDLGPEGGDAGGYILDVGTPEELADRADKTGSKTGYWVRKYLRNTDDN